MRPPSELDIGRLVSYAPESQYPFERCIGTLAEFDDKFVYINTHGKSSEIVAYNFESINFIDTKGPDDSHEL